MFSFSICPYTQQEFNLASFSFHLHLPGVGGERPKQGKPLSIPWADLQETPDTYSLLTWHTHKGLFAGRGKELAELRRWAQNSRKVSVRFLTAPGGAGKSRLAAEFADRLDSEGWSAGFVDLSRPATFESGRSGTLMVIDYPEEHRDGVATLLSDLAKVVLDERLRILFLTRSSMDEWRSIITDAGARMLVDWSQVELGALTPDEGHEIYSLALELAAEVEGSSPPPLSVGAVGKWMRMVPQNALPLFLVATAVYSAQNPDEVVVTYSGPEIIAALTERETARLHHEAEDIDLPADALALALTYATMCKGVPLAVLDCPEAKVLRDWLGLQNDKGWKDILLRDGNIRNGTLCGLEPDIMGADFVYVTLARNQIKAPAIAYAAAAHYPKASAGIFGRLIYDAQFTLGREIPHLQHWLLYFLQSIPHSCSALFNWTTYILLPDTLLDCSIQIELTVLAKEEDEYARAKGLNNLSIHLTARGQHGESLVAIQHAVDTYRKLYAEDNAKFKLDLIQGLNNLALSLSALGQHRNALQPSQEAVDLSRQLAEQDMAAYGTLLAQCLNTLSNRLFGLGKDEAGLQAIQEAVEISRRLIEQGESVLGLSFARWLLNYSTRLCSMGQHTVALATCQEAVDAFRELAEQNPASFEQYYAGSLNNLSLCFSELNQHEPALLASQEAVAIFRRHIKHSILSAGVNFAISLNGLAKRLAALGRFGEASTIMAEVEGIERRLEEAQRMGAVEM